MAASVLNGLSVKGAATIGGGLLTVNGGMSVLYDDTIVAAQGFYGAAIKTGLSAGNSQAVISVQASHVSFVNDSNHDYNVGLRVLNYTANGAGVVVSNLAYGDGVYINTSVTSGDGASASQTSWGLNITAGTVSTLNAVGDAVHLQRYGAGAAISIVTNTGAGTGAARKLPGGRSVTDAVTTSGSATVTSATAAFVAGDVGTPISGAGIPYQTTIQSVTNSTTAVMTANATATATGVALGIGSSITGFILPDIYISHGSGVDCETFDLSDGGAIKAHNFNLTRKAVGTHTGSFFNLFAGGTGVAFNGTGITMNFGASGGSFGGNFLVLNNNGSTQFYIDSVGSPNVVNYVMLRGTNTAHPQMRILNKMTSTLSTSTPDPGIFRDSNDVVGINTKASTGSVATFVGGTKSNVLDDGAGAIDVAAVKVREGANATMGTGTLVAGSAVISTTKVTANSRIFVGDSGGGTLANIGSLYVSARTAGTSFTVSSTNALDTSTFVWLLVEPG